MFNKNSKKRILTNKTKNKINKKIKKVFNEKNEDILCEIIAVSKLHIGEYIYKTMNHG